MISYLVSTILILILANTIPSFAETPDADYPILISVSINGKGGIKGSINSVISSDGKFVAFQSSATDIIPIDYNRRDDVFVRDLEKGTTKLVSDSGFEWGAFGHSTDPSISSNGRFIAFRSSANNLFSPDVNGRDDIFVYDQLTGQTKLVSISSNDNQANGDSSYPSINADGRFISFVSKANNLAEEAGNIFVRDLIENKTIGLGVFGYCYLCTNYISGDGRYVTFGSINQLTKKVSSNEGDIFLYDLRTKKIQQVSVPFDGTQLHYESEIPYISSDGRFISFSSDAPNLVNNDSNDGESIFVRDLLQGVTEVVSINDVGQQVTPKDLTRSVISADGRFVAFSYDNEIFVHDRHVSLTSKLGFSGIVTSISQDGIVSFHTNEGLVAHDDNENFDVYIAKFIPPLQTPERNIPSWIKFNAKSWADDKITDSNFLEGLGWLINNKIILVPQDLSYGSADSQKIPDWFKSNARWWADDSITDEDFVKGSEWLISSGILKL